jgi:hypothetical protein
MTNRFLISVAAAALIAGTGFANAQGTNRESGGAAGGGSTVQQNAPGERAAPSATQKAGETGGMKGAQTDQKAPGAAKSQQAEDGLKGGKDMKAEGREGKTVGQAPQSKDSMSKDSMSKDSAQSKDGMSKDSTTTTQSKEGMSKDGTTNAQTKSGADKSGERSQTTTGNAATSATAAPPAEKRTQIVSAIRQERIQETTNVNFNISVGATVPATVRFHPVPARIVEIYPEWRGYEIVLVHGRYIIVRPQTHEIVYIIEG